MKKFQKLIIFDLDGTLYQLRGGSYSHSPLRKAVLLNAQKFIARRLNLNNIEAVQILGSIQKKYGEDFSIALEKEYGISRNDYFKTVWNISARGITEKDIGVDRMLSKLRKESEIALVSEAPRIWITRVLRELQLERFFRGAIFSGEGDERKGFGNAFKRVTKKFNIKPSNCIVIGDQEKTDIIPAKDMGMKTIFMNRNKKSYHADYNVKNTTDLEKKLLQLLREY